jgi:acyl-CoA dehydrogenase
VRTQRVEDDAMLGFDLSPEQLELKKVAHRFAVEEIIPVAARHDEEQRFPEEVARKAWDLGLMNLEVPREYGGLGLGVLDTCLVLEELNYGCAGITNAVAANGLAAIPVAIAGDDAQKKRYLGELAGEFSFAAFCITEPGAGSDVAGMSTTYRRLGDSFVLNGTKHFISNGTVARWYVVFATADRKARHAGISAFVFPSDLPGIKKHRMKNKLGQRAADTGEVVFEEVEVPKAALLGEEGQGFKIAMQTFDRSRPEIGAIAIGVSQRALDESVRYAKERQQFGQPIAQFQAIQFMLADMAIEVEAMRLLTYKAAWVIDGGAPASIVSSYAKAFGADHAMRITTDAVQVFGGYGYMKEYPVEKLMRDAKLLQIYEGTSQVQRVVIARNLLKS